MEQPTPSSLFDLQLDEQTGNYLGEAARWARFLAILGFILCGFMVVIALFMGSLMSGALSNMSMGGPAVMTGGFFSFFYILNALVYFFPCLYLFQFATKARTALANNDQDTLAVSFRNLKACFKFVGVLAIIGLTFIALALIALVIGGVAHR